MRERFGQRLQDGPEAGDVNDEAQQEDHSPEGALWGPPLSQLPIWRNSRLRRARKEGVGDTWIKTAYRC